MRAITVPQPGASAIASGLKHYLIQSAEPPKGMIGETIAIHADSRFTYDDKAYLKALRANDCHPCFDDEPPLGCLIATATLKACLPSERAKVHVGKYVDDPEWRFEEDLTDFSPGKFAWALTGVVAFENPIPCSGPHHLLLDLPIDVDRAIEMRTLEEAVKEVFRG